ncbi:hypothetical protein L7F22_046586 [Adiantum nelumboides]|nr:hypothetical protein [Adiantum nelumboides]
MNAIEMMQQDVEGDTVLEDSFKSESSGMESDSTNDNEAFCEDFHALEQCTSLHRSHDNELKVYPNLQHHVSQTYFAYNRVVYYFIRVLQSGVTTTYETLKSYDSKGMLDLKKKQRMKNTLNVGHGDDGVLCLHLKDNPTIRIACIEDWKSIVKMAHSIEGEEHQGINKTLDAIKSKWCTDVRRHGIPISYVKEFIDACRCKSSNKELGTSTLHQKVHSNKEPVVVICIKKSDIQIYLSSIMIDHKTRLIVACSFQKNGASRSTMVDYICNQGGMPRKKGSKKRTRTSKQCGCSFKIQVESFDDHDDVKIYLQASHSGHIPGSRNDLYHLPAHCFVIKCCKEDLFDVENLLYGLKCHCPKKDFIWSVPLF